MMMDKVVIENPISKLWKSLLWRHNGRDSVSNHQPHGCLLKCLFRRRSKKTSKPCVTGLCAGNSPGTGEFPAQMASNAENVSIWWRHHVILPYHYLIIITYMKSKVIMQRLRGHAFRETHCPDWITRVELQHRSTCQFNVTRQVS